MPLRPWPPAWWPGTTATLWRAASRPNRCSRWALWRCPTCRRPKQPAGNRPRPQPPHPMPRRVARCANVRRHAPSKQRCADKADKVGKAGKAAKPSKAQSKLQPAFTEDFIAPLSPRRVARWAARHGVAGAGATWRAAAPGRSGRRLLRQGARTADAVRADRGRGKPRQARAHAAEPRRRRSRSGQPPVEPAAAGRRRCGCTGGPRGPGSGVGPAVAAGTPGACYRQGRASEPKRHGPG
jgi:hypothetical protein